MKRKNKVLFFTILLTSILSGCTQKNVSANKVVIYSCAEDYRNDQYLKRLNEQFPDYDISLQYMSTGNLAAKLKAEGGDTECDIILELEYGYLDLIKDNLADLSSYDTSAYIPELLGKDMKYIPETRNSGSIIINTDILVQKGLTEPESYEDLLNPQYKGLISMPNPKSSGTGYMFVKSLVNAWGEDKTFQYFDKLSDNVLQYTSSGSGPVNALLQGEACIGLGMTAQAVTQINDGAPFKLLFFEEGAPYSMYGSAIIKGKDESASVKEVFSFINSTLIDENNKLFFPEPLFRNGAASIENYPTNIIYANMDNDSIEEKERLLKKWNH